MLLQQVTIAGYRGIRNLDLQSPGRFCLIVGPNNAGKTSILEAAALLCRPFDPGQWVQTARSRDPDCHPADGIWGLFPESGTLDLESGPQESESVSLSGSLAGRRRELSATAAVNQGWEFEASSSSVVATVEARVTEFGGVRQHTMQFRRDGRADSGLDVAAHRCFSLTSTTHRSFRTLSEHLSKALDENRKDVVIEMMRVFDPAVQGIDLSLLPDRPGIRVTLSERGVVDLASLGDGMRRSTAFAATVARAGGGVVLADEIEAGIHRSALPDVLVRLAQAARETDVQIISTTHSLEAVDALIEAFEPRPEDLVTFFVRRGGDGTQVRRYDFGRLLDLRSGGLDIR